MFALLYNAEQEQERLENLRLLNILRRQLRKHSNPFDFDPEMFRKLYR